MNGKLYGNGINQFFREICMYVIFCKVWIYAIYINYGSFQYTETIFIALLCVIIKLPELN